MVDRAEAGCGAALEQVLAQLDAGRADQARASRADRIRMRAIGREEQALADRATEIAQAVTEEGTAFTSPGRIARATARNFMSAASSSEFRTKRNSALVACCAVCA